MKKNVGALCCLATQTVHKTFFEREAPTCREGRLMMFEQTGQGRSLENTRLTLWKAAKDETNYISVHQYGEMRERYLYNFNWCTYKPKKDYRLTIYQLR